MLIKLIFGQQGEHELKNMQAKFNATEFKSSRYMEKTTYNGKTYLIGEAKRYKSEETLRALQPFVDYRFISGAADGQYVVTVTYRIDKKLAGDKSYITLGVDELSPVKLELSNSALSTRISADFDVSLLRGKRHLLKIWLPSQGVMIEKIEIRRRLINKKKDDK